jgi:hypothetical protein
VATRSVKITFNNNTPFELDYYQDMLCHGYYNNSPPQTIAANSTVQWQSSSHDPGLEGTEGWVKYTCNNDELVFVYWNLPYFLMDIKSPPAPLDIKTTVSDVDTNTQGHTNSPYCSTDTPLVWPNPPPGTTPVIVPGNAPATNLFAVYTDGTMPPGFDPTDVFGLVWDTIFAWPLILGGLAGDVNLSFAIGLRLPGSMGDSIRKFYDGNKGLLALAVRANQPSLRKLFAM